IVLERRPSLVEVELRAAGIEPHRLAEVAQRLGVEAARERDATDEVVRLRRVRARLAHAIERDLRLVDLARRHLRGAEAEQEIHVVRLLLERGAVRLDRALRLAARLEQATALEREAGVARVRL